MGYELESMTMVQKNYEEAWASREDDRNILNVESRNTLLTAEWLTSIRIRVNVSIIPPVSLQLLERSLSLIAQS